MGKTVLILANDAKTLLLFRREVLEELLRYGCRVIISLPSDPAIAQLKQLGCEIAETRVNRRGMNPFQDLGLLIRYWRLIRSVRPSVVLTYTIKPNVYGGMAARWLRVPSMATITGLGTSIQNPGLLRLLTLFLYRRGLKGAKRVFCQNDSIEELLLRERITLKERIVRVPGSGVNLEKHRFQPFPEDDGTTRFVFIGRLMRDKGVEELAQAARRIKKEYPNTFFEVIGGYEERYESLIDSLCREGTIHYAGYQNDIRPFLAPSHAIILPSYHEGMANVLLEAAAAGRVILASAIPGCEETFDEGVSGIGFRARDAEDLTRALKQFIGLPYSQKERMGLAGRKKMETNFDRRLVIDRYLQEVLS